MITSDQFSSHVAGYIQGNHTIFLKLHIARTFDLVDWSFLLELMQYLRFPRRWCNWIAILLSTASTKIMMNGRPRRRIARGLRQEDLISPMLFVLVMDVLNLLMQPADNQGLFTPIPGNIIQHRPYLYADDGMLFLAPTHQNLLCLLGILDLFAGATGLVTNKENGVARPIRCSVQIVS